MSLFLSEYISKNEFQPTTETTKILFQDHIENYLNDETTNKNSDTIKLNVTLKISDDAKKMLNEMNIKLNDQVIVSNKKVC